MNKKIHLMSLYAILSIVPMLAYPYNLSPDQTDKREQDLSQFVVVDPDPDKMLFIGTDERHADNFIEAPKNIKYYPNGARSAWAYAFFNRDAPPFRSGQVMGANIYFTCDGRQKFLGGRLYADFSLKKFLHQDSTKSNLMLVSPGTWSFNQEYAVCHYHKK